jgi:hypothetical protein
MAQMEKVGLGGAAASDWGVAATLSSNSQGTVAEPERAPLPAHARLGSEEQPKRTASSLGDLVQDMLLQRQFGDRGRLVLPDAPVLPCSS